MGWIVYINKSRGLGVALLLVHGGFQLRLIGVFGGSSFVPFAWIAVCAVWLRCQYVRAKVAKSMFVTCYDQC